MKKVNNFQIAKFLLRVLLSFCLIFCQFQPGVAYKMLLIKKRVLIHQILRSMQSLENLVQNIYLSQQKEIKNGVTN